MQALRSLGIKRKILFAAERAKESYFEQAERVNHVQINAKIRRNIISDALLYASSDNRPFLRQRCRLTL